ncbi:MAG TPA: hypothetical protein VM736_02370, partial [Gemmatimonadales bacterium]|nr:hypothetical protein [Gemmatimonadales bacterium]
TQCASCAKAVCTTHQGVCEVDGLVHCSQHLRRTDTSRRTVCARHVATCAQEPAVTFASDEVAPCPVCGKAVCTRHRAPCEYCGRLVCTADLASVAPGRGRRPGLRCSTCTHLAAVRDPPDALISAALTATSGRPKPPRVWRMARDRTHVVVEVDLGLTRTTVFTVRHGQSVPDSIVNHSLLGSKRRR